MFKICYLTAEYDEEETNEETENPKLFWGCQSNETAFTLQKCDVDGCYKL